MPSKPAAEANAPAEKKAETFTFTKDFDFNSKVDPKTGAVLEQHAYTKGSTFDTLPAKVLDAARKAGALPAAEGGE